LKISLSSLNIKSSVEEKLKSLLRKRKDSPEDLPVRANKTDLDKSVLAEQVGNEKKGKQIQKVGAALEKKAAAKTEEVIQEPEAEMPIKVTIPASALKEELTDEIILQRETSKTWEPVPEEVADSLLVVAKPPDSIPEPALKLAQNEDKDSLFSGLFENVAEDETSIDRLIKSLPDISIEEVLNQSEETKRFINQWPRK
jgi:hypothetical protein